MTVCANEGGSPLSGIDIEVQDIGSGVTGTVVIIAAFITAPIYEYQVTALAEAGYRVVLITVRGTPDSSQPFFNNNDNLFDIWASDVNQVINALDLRCFTLFAAGTSTGIALRYIGCYGDERLKNLILGEVLNPEGASLAPPVLEAILVGLRADREATLELFTTLEFFPCPASAAQREWRLDEAERVPLWFYINLFTSQLDRPEQANLVADAKCVKVPTLIFHGAQDVVLSPSFAVDLHSLIPNSQLVFFECGNTTILQQNNAVNDLILSFAASGTCSASAGAAGAALVGMARHRHPIATFHHLEGATLRDGTRVVGSRAATTPRP